MIEVDTELKLGEIGVVTSQNRGHPPEFWAERCTARICGISYEKKISNLKNKLYESQLDFYYLTSPKILQKKIITL